MRLTIILDPDIFFQSSYDGELIIHPFLANWLERAMHDETIEILNVYFLVKTPGTPSLNINISNQVYNLPFNNIFFRSLSADALAFIKTIWDRHIHFADIDLSGNTSTGIKKYTDGYQPADDEIILFTADDETNTFFKKKNIAVFELSKPRLLVSSCPDLDVNGIDPLKNINYASIAIYCDFDGTLYDLHQFRLLYFIQEECTDDKDYSILNPQALIENELFIHSITTDFLSKLKQASTYLLTQRNYQIDQVQPRCNNAGEMVRRINLDKQLNIQFNENSFLCADIQINQENTYVKKIEHIYWLHKQQSADQRPNCIILIDDNIEEHGKIEMSKPYFGELGIEVISIMVVDSAYYSKDLLASLAYYVPSIYKPLEKIILQQQEKLMDLLTILKYKQAKSHADVNVNLAGSHLLAKTNPEQISEGDSHTPANNNRCCTIL